MVLDKLSRDRNSEPGSPENATKADDSVVSRSMKIIGDCETGGRLRIEGTVTGGVTAGELEIASTGSVEGDVVVGQKGDRGGRVLVHGRIAGSVRGRTVEIGDGGAVDAGVRADEAVVRGRIQGGILARDRLVLEETAEVKGDVRARRFAVKEGGRVNGTVRMGEKAVRSHLEATGDRVDSADTTGATESEDTEEEEGPSAEPRAETEQEE